MRIVAIQPFARAALFFLVWVFLANATRPKVTDSGGGGVSETETDARLREVLEAITKREAVNNQVSQLPIRLRYMYLLRTACPRFCLSLNRLSSTTRTPPPSVAHASNRFVPSPCLRQVSLATTAVSYRTCFAYLLGGCSSCLRPSLCLQGAPGLNKKGRTSAEGRKLRDPLQAKFSALVRNEKHVLLL